MKTLSRTEIFSSPPLEVFKAIDDLGVTGMHMTKSSMTMMGSKLKLEFLTDNKTGLGSKYRWTGKMMGIPMDFTVIVTKWQEGVEKVWETIGPTKLIIYSWYRMELKIKVNNEVVDAVLSISYEKPQGTLNKILSLLFADWYCRWCLKQMLGDAKKSVDKKQLRSRHLNDKTTVLPHTSNLIEVSPIIIKVLKQ